MYKYIYLTKMTLLYKFPVRQFSSDPEKWCMFDLDTAWWAWQVVIQTSTSISEGLLCGTTYCMGKRLAQNLYTRMINPGAISLTHLRKDLRQFLAQL